MSQRKNVLTMYKNMLRMANSVSPEKKRSQTVKMIQNEFRKHADQEDESTIQALLEKANSSLGYLKIITPKQTSQEGQSGRTRMIFGEEGARKSTVTSNWTGSNMDPDQVSRHYHGLKRAGFTDNKSVVGGLF